MVEHGGAEAKAGSFAAFARDLRWGFAAWKTDPDLFIAAFGYVVVLAGLTAAEHVAGPSRGIAALATPVFLLVFGGIFGVERVWYHDILNGRPVSWERVRKLNGDFRSRFVRLGLLLVPLGLLLVPFLVTQNTTIHYVGAVIYGLIVDMLLTFVTIELTFTTSSAVDAARLGLERLRSEWPRCAWYVLVPPLALQFVVVLGGGTGNAAVRIIGGVLIGPLAIACRGATLRYYEREVQPLPAVR